ncbi:alcohol dehydrogenase, iron-dependent [Necator americanus]|uniref:hydroxyacid-oxoacid transhydrogenase n=1 Tax=Necator americanus TaxID=51031 RepID=W2T493_NECAM|nr:alcohol dehydrogenase, iron-dependent [Necator americanus]ETN76830.1 alcohol dehydrogenase, iron-dependent [Necator americanus]
MICSTIRFGKGVTSEIGYDIRNLGSKHTLVVTDKNVINTAGFKSVAQSLQSLGVKYTVFDDVLIEPTDGSMLKAVDFARNVGCDSFVAVGGGSVIDTTKAMFLFSVINYSAIHFKAAALYCSNPEADFYDFVCPPFGKNLVPKKPMLPLIAVPTTAGTGSETTGAAIMDLPKHQCKSGIRQRCIKPLLAIVDPDNIKSMPRNVAIYSGFDVLCHALESYTALPYHKRSPRPARPELRPLYQGSNPISDVWSMEALRIMGKYFRRSVADSSDEEAREHMLLASTFAGVGFGNAGVHICHGLSYPISSQGKSYFDKDYPETKPLIPHGLSVVTTAVADFEFLTSSCPERHAQAARQLGADVPVGLLFSLFFEFMMLASFCIFNANESNASDSYIAGKLCDELRSFMRDFHVPNGLEAMGFKFSDIDKLSTAAVNSVVNIAITPKEADREIISKIYEKSFKVY